MNVLFISSYTALYGANRSLLQLILELRERGVKPTVMLPYPVNGESEFARELRANDIRYIEAPIRSVKHPSFWKVIPNYLLAIFNYPKIIRLLKGEKFDIIHSNSSIITIGSILAKKLNAKHVWHLREFGDLDYRLRTPFSKRFQKYIYRGDNHFICISKAIARHYFKWLGKSDYRIIYNGILPGEQRLTDYHKTINQICIVGYITPEKGQFEVIRAINQLVKGKNYHNFHLNLWGSAQPNYLIKLEDYIEREDLEKYVSFRGHSDRIYEELTKMDIGITPSFNEAFGRVTIEYMMAGLGVIVSDGGANTELVQDNINGLVYNRGNISELTECIYRLCTDEVLYSTLSNNAKELALNKFTSYNNTANIYSLYKDISNS